MTAVEVFILALYGLILWTTYKFGYSVGRSDRHNRPQTKARPKGSHPLYDWKKYGD